jgi:hypothetical protein
MCKNAISELVPRKPNRMIIIGPNRPFQFSTSSIKDRSNYNNDREEIDSNFESDTMIALVITLALSE